MKGFRNYKRYLEGHISRITPAKTYGLLYHLPEGYPAMLEGNEIVEGEVVEPVDEKLLKALDWLEDYDERSSDNLYKRVPKTVFTDDGKELNCWTYIYTDEKYARERGIPVPDGNWRKFMDRRKK